MQHQGPPNGERRPKSKVTRKEAATILATSPQNVINLERRGKLRAYPDRSKVVLYFLAQVEALRKVRADQKKGSTMSQLFASFRAKDTLDVIVEKTGLAPDYIGRAYQQYLGGLKLWEPAQRPDPAAAKFASEQERSLEESRRQMDAARAKRIAALLPKSSEPTPGRPRGTKR